MGVRRMEEPWVVEVHGDWASERNVGLDTQISGRYVKDMELAQG